MEEMDTTENIIYSLVDHLKFGKAHQMLDGLLEAEPNSDRWHLLRGFTFYRQRQDSESIGSYRRAIMLNPENARALSDLATIMAIQLDFEEAKTLIGKALKVDPENLDYQSQLAFYEFKLKDYRAALAICNRALERDPRDDYFTRLRGSVHAALKDFPLAIIDAKKAVETAFRRPASGSFHDVAGLLNNLGYYYAENNELYKAKVNLERALELNRGAAYPNNNLGYVYLKEGNYRKAMQLINESIAIDPSNPFAFKNRALVYLELKQPDEARKDLLHARSLGFKEDYGGDVDELLQKHFNC